jgi:hypothetical protein
MENRQLLLDGAHGIYVPQRFSQVVSPSVVENVSSEDWFILSQGPDHEFYWEAWETVLNNAILVGPTGSRYCLEQDGDLFICLLETMH